MDKSALTVDGPVLLVPYRRSLHHHLEKVRKDVSTLMQLQTIIRNCNNIEFLPPVHKVRTISTREDQEIFEEEVPLAFEVVTSY